jgi:hypothetical protein
MNIILCKCIIVSFQTQLHFVFQEQIYKSLTHTWLFLYKSIGVRNNLVIYSQSDMA